MKDKRISKRYAAALFESSSRCGNVEEIFNNFGIFINFCKEMFCLKEFFSQTYIGKIERWEVAEMLSSRLSLSGNFFNFLRLLIDNERAGYIEDIFKEFSTLRDSALNIARIKVVSAGELSHDRKEKIKAVIEKALNKTAEISFVFEPDIIGGYIIEIENTLYDGSIKTQLDNLYISIKKEVIAYGA